MIAETVTRCKLGCVIQRTILSELHAYLIIYSNVLLIADHYSEVVELSTKPSKCWSWKIIVQFNVDFV